MKPELTLVGCAVGLAVVQMLVAVTGSFLQVGLIKLAGNRDDMPKMTGWAGRAERAHRNMMENLVLFVALAVALVVAGKTSNSTLLGAQIFVWARLAYAVIYLIGIPWLRTGAWVVSMAGLVMMFVALL